MIIKVLLVLSLPFPCEKKLNKEETYVSVKGEI